MRVLKWLGIIVGAVVVLALGTFLYFKSAANARLEKTYEVKVEPIPIPYPLTEAEVQALKEQRAAELAAQAPPSADGGVPDTAAAPPDPLAGVDLVALAKERALERADHYMRSRAACMECHAEDFGGKVVIENPAMGAWIAPNITAGGTTKDYTDADWVRLIRHCVKPDGRPATMPCQDFTWFSDQEIADIVTFIKSKPVTDRVMPPIKLGPVLSMLVATGQIKFGPEELDHTTPRVKLPPQIAPTEELGKHLAATCSGCHGADFTGGPIVGGDPKWPPAKNLTFHDTGLAKWSLDDFKKTMRTGVRPDGSKLDPVMNIAYTGALKDAEIEGIYKYLQTIEKKPTKPK
jgi:cytochrome c553